jgi:hypothetical protein
MLAVTCRYGGHVCVVDVLGINCQRRALTVFSHGYYIHRPSLKPRPLSIGCHRKCVCGIVVPIGKQSRAPGFVVRLIEFGDGASYLIVAPRCGVRSLILLWLYCNLVLER